jgi:hypothetical protein
MKLFNLFKKSKPAKLVFRTISDLDLITFSQTQVPMCRVLGCWKIDCYLN